MDKTIEKIRELETKYHLKLLEDDDKTFTSITSYILVMTMINMGLEIFELVYNLSKKEDLTNE